MISKREKLKRFEFLKFIPSTIHPFIIQFDPTIRGLKTAEPLCKCRQRNIKNLTMHFYGHTLSDIPKRTRNTKQDACSPLHPLSLRNDKFKHQREREKEREREMLFNLQEQCWNFTDIFLDTNCYQNFHSTFVSYTPCVFSVTNILSCVTCHIVS